MCAHLLSISCPTIFYPSHLFYHSNPSNPLCSYTVPSPLRFHHQRKMQLLKTVTDCCRCGEDTDYIYRDEELPVLPYVSPHKGNVQGQMNSTRRGPSTRHDSHYGLPLLYREGSHTKSGTASFSGRSRSLSGGSGSLLPFSLSARSHTRSGTTSFNGSRSLSGGSGSIVPFSLRQRSFKASEISWPSGRGSSYSGSGSSTSHCVSVNSQVIFNGRPYRHLYL